MYGGVVLGFFSHILRNPLFIFIGPAKILNGAVRLDITANIYNGIVFECVFCVKSYLNHLQRYYCFCTFKYLKLNIMKIRNTFLWLSMLLLLVACKTNPFTGEKNLNFVSNEQLFPASFEQYKKKLQLP